METGDHPANATHGHRSQLSIGANRAFRPAVKIEVADELTNLDRQHPLGLVVRHEVSLAGLADPAVRLAGNPDPAVNDYYSPANPSVHVSLADQGLDSWPRTMCSATKPGCIAGASRR